MKCLTGVPVPEELVLDCGCSPAGPCPTARALFARRRYSGSLIMHLSYAYERTLIRKRREARRADGGSRQ